MARASAGGAFTSLSNSFETGGTGICIGTETNLVRALAAGGALDANGLSNVIYAGTDGDGPFTATSPTGGHLWVSSNAAGGPASWNDRTGSINPQHFPISSIAVDTSDSSGLTAYVSIMGFHVSHLWKTTDGGVSWSDFTRVSPNALPDVPANAVIVDPGTTPATGIVYVGTDVGVFASNTGAPSWSEVGPSAASHAPGFLPNVAVTSLSIFGSSSGTRLLRVSTYGRGLWELAQFNMSPPVPGEVTVAVSSASAPVTFQLTGSGGNVSLSCVPAWCNFSGNPVQIPVSVTMTVTPPAGSPNGTSYVAIHALLSGYPSTATQNLIVNVTGGFSFSITNGLGPQTVAAEQAAIYNLTVAPSSGTFADPVVLTCPSGLPAMSTCSFNPAQVAAGSGSTAVALTIATAAQTPSGSYSAIAVSGTSDSITATTNIALTVGVAAGSNFSITNTTGPQAINAGQSANYVLNVAPSAGVFSSPVSLACSGLPASSSCTFSPSTVNAGNAATPVTLTVATAAGTAGTAGTPSGTYSIIVTGTSNSQNAAATVILTINVGSGAFSFMMTNSGPATIAAGSSGMYDITVTPSARVFPNPVTITSSACPPVTTCSFSTMQVAAGSGATDIFLTLATTAPATDAVRRQGRLLSLSVWLPFSLIIVFGGIGASRFRKILPALLATGLLGICFGCGGLTGGSAAPAGNPGTPVGTYTITVIGTSGSVTANTNISVTIGTAQ